MSIIYLSHTADIRMNISAQSIEELFNLGLKGMSNILKKNVCNHNNKNNKSAIIEIQSNDYTNLLIDFLSVVLSHSYVDNAIYCTIDIQEFSEFKIKAEVKGVELDKLDEEIKAVTYHEANVKKDTDQRWKTTIIFDI